MLDDDLKIEEVADGSGVTRRGLFGLQNSEILMFMFGAIGSGAVLFGTNLGLSASVLVPLTPFPLLIALIIIFLLHGKPPHYAADVLEGTTTGNNFLPYCPKIYNRCPDGMFSKNLIIWDDLGHGSWAVGIELHVPAIDYSKNTVKNTYKRRIDSFLNFFAKEGMRVQLYWSVSSDYLEELQQYESETATLPEGVCKTYRTIRQEQYRALAAGRELRRERLLIYISRPLADGEKISWNLSLHEYDDVSRKILDDLQNAAVTTFERIRAMFESSGIRCHLLEAQELCQVLRSYFNPNQSLAPQLFTARVNQDLSIKEQVLYSDMISADQASFRLDGQLYNVIALRAPLPKAVYWGMIGELTKLGILDYHITVNIIPRDSQRVMTEEESAVKILENQVSQKNAPVSLNFALQKRTEMVGELFSGRTAPLDVQYLIAVHAPELEELQVKTTSIKGALTRLGIGYYQLSHTKNAINCYFQGTPGWLSGSRQNHSFRTLDKYLTPLLPISSTYTGNLIHAEAIYQGEQRNLVGVKQFAKRIAVDSDPQHAILFGKTGSGKSVLTEDLLMQTHGFYGYTCIIDYGLSYKALAEQLGYAPIFLGPSSNITINYFDTRGLPLTGAHLSMVGIILRVMCGNLASDGMIMRYLKPFYIDYADDFLKRHREYEPELITIARLSDAYLAARECDDEIEAWQRASREWTQHVASVEDQAKYLYDNRERVLYQVFAKFRPEDFPTHTLFVTYLRSKPLPEEEDLKLLQETSDALELWQANGKNGRLFDGVTNLNLDSDFEYFELSAVPSNDPGFKFVAGALIQMVAMSKIETMDRAIKKRLIIDEANSFFELPQGAKVIEAAMTKYRKHRCSVLISFQQYEMLDHKEIKEAVVSNIHQFLLMGQSDRNDVDKLGNALGLSDAIKEAILAFETPANLPAHNRYSSFAQVQKSRGTIAGVARNAMTQDLLTLIGINTKE